MQKQRMFESFMKKKQMINKMISESKSPKNSQRFQHFQAVSEPVYIKAESNAIYLTHLNTEFKDQLREFVHQQESFKQTMFQLANITESLQTEHEELEKQQKTLRNEFNEVDLEKHCLSDKNDMLLQKILTLQQQGKSLQVRSQEYEKIATGLEQDIEYEKCLSAEIKQKNIQIIQQLQIKSAQIQTTTARLEDNQRQIRQKESKIKNINQDIKSVYYTLEAQDDALSNLCTAIQQGLNKQNDRINDIQFAKNDLSRILNESEERKKQIQQAEQIQQKLIHYEEDLDFDLRRTSKQLELEEKGIDEEYWKIQQENQRLIENQRMLAELRQFLADLVEKNQVMERCLEEQIIQDYAVKKVVESKCLQPVGKKTKLFLQEIQEKQMADTQTSWCKQNMQSPVHRSQMNSKSPVNRQVLQTPSVSKRPARKQVGKLSGRVPLQMQFVFEKFNKSIDQCRQQKQQEEYGQEDPYMNTGFTYIDQLRRLQSKNQY